MGISRITNADHSLKPAPYDRRQAYRVNAQGEPLETVLVHPDGEVSADLVFQPLPAWMHSPRWDGRQWREASRWAGIIRVLAYLLLLGCCLFFATHSQAQTNENIAKVGGVNQSGDNVIDTTNHAVKVNVVAGGGTGGGPSDAAATAAASESDTARQKVFSALRLLDSSQAAGSQLVTALGDQTSGLWINCKAGCTSATDNTTGSTALGALNATIAVAMTGARGANFQLQAAGTLIGTITPQCSFDGGTIYNANGYIQDPFSGVVSTTATIASAQATTDYPVMCPQGSSNARMKVTSFTSGTANFVARSTVATWPSLDWGIVTTSAPSYTAGQINGLSLNTSGGLRTDGSGVTQPVSGTVTTTPPANASTNVAQLAGTTTDTNSGAKSAGTLRVVLATDQPALTNKLLVTPDSVALPANQSVNVNQLAGTTTDTNSGTKSAGTLRVVLATDQPALTNKLLVTPDSVALPANQSVNEAQIGGVAPSIDSSGRQITKLYPDTTTTSYHASKKFAASSTTDVAVMPGNATNKVILDKVTLTCTQTTAGQINVELVKRSAADTVGTSASITAVPDYSSYAAAVSAPLSYTGTGPTTGAAVGDLDNAQIGCMAAATATPNDVYVFRPAKPIILNGTAEQVAINLGGAITGGNITVTFDWRETTTP